MTLHKIENRRWYVLTTHDPEDSEKQLFRAFEERIANNRPICQTFIPYQYLQRRIAQKASDKELTSSNNIIRSALRRYIFALADESMLVAFLAEGWNMMHHNRIQFFRNHDGQNAYVLPGAMNAFMTMLADKHLDFDLVPAFENLQKGEPIRFRNNTFEGRTFYVIESRSTNRGNVVTVGVDLVSSALQIKVYDVHSEDIIYLNEATSTKAKNSDLIKRNSAILLSILARRINKKEDKASRLKDAHDLDAMFISRFRHFDENQQAAHRRFLAQVLVCACLRHDPESKETYTSHLLAQLSEINTLPESKAATDVRARIHAALFLATGIPEYRAAARDYVRKHNPKSESLQTLIRLISKREALKNI